MVDYTTKESRGSGIGLYLAIGAIVLVLLYALFAGGGATTTTDPATLGLQEEAPAAPAVPADGAGATITE